MTQMISRKGENDSRRSTARVPKRYWERKGE